MKPYRPDILLLLLYLLLYLLLSSPAGAESPFNHLWSGFSTSLTSRSPEQRRNAAVAGQALDGAIIPPGGMFSFNELVGARDRDKGFVPAPHLNSSGTLDETPGGGICQLASTVYNAGLLAGLEIVERHPHSRAVAHVPPGRDATISSWRKDLRLRNPFPHPLLLRITSDNDRLTASFRSAMAREFQVEVRSRQVPLEPETVAGRTASTPQPGARGFSTQTMRIIRKDGIETSQLVSEDSYPAPSRIISGGGE
ncbi:MAG: VanW family protein [Desulfuromonadales bacterium]|nr:VanW family protein [Desulfuromonadales bacterium]